MIFGEEKAWQVMKALGLSDSNGWARFIAGQYQYSLVKATPSTNSWISARLKASDGCPGAPWGRISDRQVLAG